VKKTFFVVLLAACCVSAAVAADSRKPTSVARPDVVAPGRITTHAFVDSDGMQAASVKVIVSDAVNNVVNVYNPAGKQLAQLTGFIEPQGLATDAKGNLYVADTVNSRIQVYAAGFKKAPKTLSDPGQYPAGVAVMNNGQFVAVTNIIDVNGGPGSVTLFKKGKAGKAILNSTFARVYFCGFDAKGNLYIDGSDVNGSTVVGRIANLTTGGKTIKVLKTGNTISFPGGVAVTTAGKIAIDDQSGAAIFTYNAPKNGSLGNPVKTTGLTGVSDTVTFAFMANDKDLWTADAGNEASYEFKYPAGGSALHTISVPGGQPIGVAVVPAQAK
jgi:NHL repeat